MINVMIIYTSPQTILCKKPAVRLVFAPEVLPSVEVAEADVGPLKKTRKMNKIINKN